MKTIIIMAIGLAAMGGCAATSEVATTASTTTAVAAATGEQRSAFVGDWSGRYAGGSGPEVRVVVPDSGTPTYYFRGRRVLVHSARVANGRLVLRTGPTGAATVTLTPTAEGTLNLHYQFGTDSAAAVMVKA
jgi:hypothetical protein